jgi:hypothetical protein
LKRNKKQNIVLGLRKKRTRRRVGRRSFIPSTKPVQFIQTAKNRDEKANHASFESNALISRKLESKIQDVAKSRIFVIAQNKDIRP